MNTCLFLTATLLTGTALSGQAVPAQHVGHIPHIEVSGTAEMQVVPDQIHIAINLRERGNGGSKVTVDKQELDLKNAVKDLGLDADWAVRAVKAGGNYAEIYERNLGTGSKLGIPRGLNQLWNMGGVLYAPPLR